LSILGKEAFSSLLGGGIGTSLLFSTLFQGKESLFGTGENALFYLYPKITMCM